MFDSDATLGASTTAYATSEEITGTGYTAGGKTLTSVTPVLDSATAVCDFGDISWTSSTFTANACLIYNSSASNKAVCSALVRQLNYLPKEVLMQHSFLVMLEFLLRVKKKQTILLKMYLTYFLLFYYF